jgi:hypothetical protein
MISGALAISRFSRVFDGFAQLPDVAVLDVPPVFAQMRGDAVRARRLANARGLDGIGFAESAPAIARLAQRGDVVNVDAKLEHNHGCDVAGATGAENKKQFFLIGRFSVPNPAGLANSFTILIAQSCWIWLSFGVPKLPRIFEILAAGARSGWRLIFSASADAIPTNTPRASSNRFCAGCFRTCRRRTSKLLHHSSANART